MPSPTLDHVFVVLAYERSAFLGACLDSLVRQSVASRIVVATSTPNDHIAEQARRVGAEMLINPTRAGMAGDFNFALHSAGARFVTLVHQDDVYQPAFLERTADLFRRRPQGALSFTGYREIDDADVVRRSKVSLANRLLTVSTLGRAEVVCGIRGRLFLAFGCAIPCSSVTFDMEKLHWFRFSSELSCCLDWEAWWRILQRGQILLRAPAPLVHRRYNAQTETSTAKREGRRQREDLMILRQIWPARIGDLVHRVYSLGY